ncbi:MAG: NAD-dependent epimerase/dehydratase family protein [bacterium]
MVNILVTGGAGFIASHIADAYIAQGHAVTIIDDLSRGKKENLNPKAEFIQQSILDEHISQIFKRGKFDLVSHHAAQIDVRVSVEHPLKDAQINVLGLINILENCRTYNVRKIIFSASGGTYYGECPAGYPDEDSPPRPMSPYGINKMVSEYYLKYYAEVFGLEFTILRYGNVYGPRQDPHGEAGVVAIFCGKILTNNEVFIFGDGLQERDYVYVDDVVSANLQALERGSKGTFNVGTGKSYSVLELFKHLKEHSKSNITAVHKPPRIGELFRSALNISKAAQQLNWKPKISITEGLQNTYDYFNQKTKERINR